jgi:hypothetical protein
LDSGDCDTPENGDASADRLSVQFSIAFSIAESILNAGALAVANKVVHAPEVGDTVAHASTISDTELFSSGNAVELAKSDTKPVHVTSGNSISELSTN